MVRLAIADALDDSLSRQSVEHRQYRRVGMVGERARDIAAVKVELGEEADMSQSASITARSSFPRCATAAPSCADCESLPSTTRSSSTHDLGDEAQGPPASRFVRHPFRDKPARAVTKRDPSVPPTRTWPPHWLGSPWWTCNT